MDLAEFQTIAKHNSNNRFVLCAINCWSKRAFCLPLKSKKSTDVANAAKIILDESKRLIGSEIVNIQTDQVTCHDGDDDDAIIYFNQFLGK